MDPTARGVVTLWHLIAMMAPLVPPSVAIAVAKVAGGGLVRYAIALAIGLGFAVLSVLGVRQLGKRGYALARSDDPRGEWKLWLIYLGAAGSACFVVPIVTALAVSAALSLVPGGGGR
jgi:hypothetical protein